MDKRTFLGFLAAALGGIPGRRLFGRAYDDAPPAGQLTNWAGNYRYSTDNLVTLDSVEKVRSYVRDHDSMRALGTRHCFNGIADSPHALVSLKPMDRVISLEPKASTVTVEAGVNYGRLGPYLHEKGFALHNLASLPHISVAGACARGRMAQASGTGTWPRRSRPWNWSRPMAKWYPSLATRTAARSSGRSSTWGRWEW